MWYVKNLPAWERALRLALAGMLAVAGWYFRDSVAAWGFGVAAVGMAATAVVGFCPMCAMVGRRAVHPRA